MEHSKLWNTLPLSIRTASTVSEFKCLLKTHFSSCAFNDGDWVVLRLYGFYCVI